MDTLMFFPQKFQVSCQEIAAAEIAAAEIAAAEIAAVPGVQYYCSALNLCSSKPHVTIR